MAQYDGSIRINTKIETREASAQLMSLENRIVKTADKIASLRSKMDSLKSAKIPTQEYSEISTQIQKAESEFNKLLEKQEQMQREGKDNGVAWERLNTKMEEVGNTIRYAKGELQELVNSGKAFTLGSDTQEYANLGQQLKYAENDLDVLIQRYNELKEKQEEIPSGFSRISNAAKSAFSKVGNVIKKTAISSFSLLGKEIKKASASMLGFGKSTKKSNDILQSSFKNILKYGLGIRSLYVLVNKIRSGIKEGFSNLANENESFKNSVNSLKASLLTLKNSFAGAFAPIVQIAIPYIQQFVGWLTRAIESVGQFIAALTGKKTYTKAIKQTASAFEDEAKAAKKAKEETEGYLSPLDEINKYSDGKNKGASAGDGAGAIGAGQMFEEAPIESRFKELVDKLKSFIKSEDWEGLGAYISSGINKGLQKIYDLINWDNVGPRITYFVNAFTRTLNSLVDNIDWDLMGRVVGAGINTFVNTMNLLIEGIDWQNLGKKFSDGIMGIVREVNWENVGRFFGNKFMILWNTLYGFVMNLKYDEIGVALGNGFNGAVKAINIGTIGATLGRAITGFFQTAINFSKTFDWKALGRNISDGINRFFQEFDGKTMAQGATKFISGILDTLIEAITTTDWTVVGRDIVDFIVNINWLELAKKLLIAAGQLVLGLTRGILQALDDTDWGKVWESILGAFKSFWKMHSPSKVMEEQGTLLMQGLFNGIQSMIDSVVELFSELKEKIVKKWNEVKAKFQEFDTWLQGIFTKDWSKSFGGLGDIFNAFFRNISNIWNSIKQIFSGITTFISGVFSGNWRQAWEGVKQIFSGIWNGLVSIIKSPINAIIGLLNGLLRGMASAVNGIARMFNSLRIDIPSWVPGIGGGRLGFNIPTWTPGSIPYLATGTVVPPNKEFLAVLGDNKQEHEVVSPISTMKQAFKEAMVEMGGTAGVSGKGGNIIVQVVMDKKVVGQATVDWAKIQQLSTGKNPLNLGTT